MDRGWREGYLNGRVLLAHYIHYIHYIYYMHYIHYIHGTVAKKRVKLYTAHEKHV